MPDSDSNFRDVSGDVAIQQAGGDITARDKNIYNITQIYLSARPPTPEEEAIVEFFANLPDLQEVAARRTLIFNAHLDRELEGRIVFDGPILSFCQVLVRTLADYGMLSDGRNALEAVLKATQQMVGLEQQRACEMLLEELRHLPAEQNPKRKPPSQSWPLWLKVALPVLSVCIVLIGVTRTLRISSTHVTLDVTSGNVRLTLSREWTCKPQFTVANVFIDNLVAIEAPGSNLARTATADENLGWLELQGTGMILREFTIAAGAEIEVSVRNHAVQLFIKRSIVTGKLQVQNAKLTMSTGEERIIQVPPLQPPENIAFTTIETMMDPIRLTLVTPEDWRLLGLQPQTLGFIEEDPPGSAKFVSVIQVGKITLRESGVTQELHEADYLTLQKPQSQQFELANAANGVHVHFEGVVTKILTGGKDVQEDLTPTWFEYLTR